MSGCACKLSYRKYPTGQAQICRQGEDVGEGKDGGAGGDFGIELKAVDKSREMESQAGSGGGSKQNRRGENQAEEGKADERPADDADEESRRQSKNRPHANFAPAAAFSVERL